MTRKTCIRAMRDDDLKMVLDWRNAPEVRQNMYHHEEITWEEHRAWFEKVINSPLDRYFIFEDEEIPSGVIAFNKIDLNHKRAHWAFYSGRISVRGLGAKMEMLALEYAFEELKLRKLCCEVLSFNAAVIQFHKKFGFEEEGILREHYWRDNQPYDIHLLALFEPQWKDIKVLFYDKLLKK